MIVYICSFKCNKNFILQDRWHFKNNFPPIQNKLSTSETQGEYCCEFEQETNHGK